MLFYHTEVISRKCGAKPNCCLPVGLAGSMPGFLADESRGMQKTTHTADFACDAECLRCMVDGSLAVHARVPVKMSLRLPALFRSGLEGATAMLVLGRAAAAAVLVSFEKNASNLFIKSDVLRHLRYELLPIKMENR